MADRKRPPLAERLQAGLEETLAWARGEGESRVTTVDEEGRRHGPELLTARELRDRIAERPDAATRVYLVVFEKRENNWSAYAPDVPGCVATGDTREETEVLFRETLEVYLESLREHGEPIPEPTTRAALISVAA